MWSVILAVFGGLVWFTPALVAHSPIWPAILNMLARPANGDIRSGPVSLGWTTPVTINDLVIRDASGASIVDVNSIRTEQTLWSLIWHPNVLGVVHIDRPKLQVRVRDEGSNIEDLVSGWMSNPSSSQPVQAAIVIKDGSMIIETEAVGPLVRLDAITGKIELDGQQPGVGKMELAQCNVQANNSEGTLHAEITWKPDDDQTVVAIDISTDSIPLAALQPAARRLDADWHLAGLLTSDVTCAWSTSNQQVLLRVDNATVNRFRFDSPSLLGADRLAMQQISLRANAMLEAWIWDIESFVFHCDTGSATISGRLPWSPDDTHRTWSQLVSHLTAADLQVEGNIDLARVAQLLPRLLRLRSDTAVRSGTLRFNLNGRNERDGRRLTGRIEASDLVAERRGQQIVWDQPLSLQLDVRQSLAGWHVEQLSCSGRFFQLAGHGTLQQGSIDLQCDLDRLLDELQQLVNTGALQMAGKLNGKVDWKRQSDQIVQAKGTGDFQNLAFSTEEQQVWREASVNTSFALEYETGSLGEVTIRSGRIQLTSASDRLEVELLEPVHAPSPQSTWAIHCKLQGQGASWLARIRQVIPLGPMDLAGSIAVDATASISPQSFDIQKASLHARPFRWSVPRLEINEPEVAVAISGQYDRTGQQGVLREATLQTSAMSVRANDVSASFSAASPSWKGNLVFRADLERLQQTWRVPTTAPRWKVLGKLNGQLSLAQQTGETHWRWDVAWNNAELARQRSAGPSGAIILPAGQTAIWETLWEDRSVNFEGSGRYAAGRQAIRLERLELRSSDQLQLWAKGDVIRPLQSCTVDVQGRVSYDLAKLIALARPYIGDGLNATGQETHEFWVRGPLFQPTLSTGPAANSKPPTSMISSSLAGETGVSWTALDLFGVVVGKAAIQAKLDQGIVRTGPIDLPLSGGHMRVVPKLQLSTNPILLTLDPGPILSDVHISKTMCQTWLKYVAPLAADATRAEGEFSATLSRATIPIGQANAIDAKATLNIKQGQVGPGPAVTPLLAAVKQLKAIALGQLPGNPTSDYQAWLVFPKQDVVLRVSKGRVYHDRLEMMIGDTLVRTRGSVGFDESLDLVAQVPIQDTWLGANPNLTLLKGMVVDIPIRGTIKEPRLDQRSVETLARKILKRAAGRVLQDELGRGLNRLFGPKR